MKKRLLILALAALMLAAACGKPTPPPAASSSAPVSSGAASAPEEPLVLTELTVELPRSVDRKAAREALKALPEKMAAYGVKLEAATLTYGASPAAMAEAVAKGGVMLAILPAEDFLAFGGGAVPILADARPGLTLDETSDPAEWNAGAAGRSSDLEAGAYALVCAAPTEYGRKLAELAQERPLTWAELDHGRWGVLAEDSLPGNRCLELWLTDHYEDNGLEDLSSVTVYPGWEELLRAAAEGEIDLLPVLPALRFTYSVAWTLETNRTDESGLRGFGRPLQLYREVPVLAATERLQSVVAAVSPTEPALQDPRFAEALYQALNELCGGPAERKAALGAECFAPVTDETLNGLRRLNFGT